MLVLTMCHIFCKRGKHEHLTFLEDKLCAKDWRGGCNHMYKLMCSFTLKKMYPTLSNITLLIFL